MLKLLLRYHDVTCGPSVLDTQTLSRLEHLWKMLYGHHDVREKQVTIDDQDLCRADPYKDLYDPHLKLYQWSLAHVGCSVPSRYFKYSLLLSLKHLS